MYVYCVQRAAVNPCKQGTRHASLSFAVSTWPLTLLILLLCLPFVCSFRCSTCSLTLLILLLSCLYLLCWDHLHLILLSICYITDLCLRLGVTLIHSGSNTRFLQLQTTQFHLIHKVQLPLALYVSSTDIPSTSSTSTELPIWALKPPSRTTHPFC